MNITIKELNARVVREAAKLKKNATKEQINNLDFETLDPDSGSYCVYGQMTGSCYSDEAEKLIEKSCIKVFNANSETGIVEKNPLGLDLNGSPKTTYRSNYWSPIEVFILRPVNQRNGNNKRLIAFLKDETKTLKFK